MVEGAHGAVAAGHAIAAEAALEVLQRGGNAIDAAVAASAVQCVVEPAWCGIGGDAFVMIDTPEGTVALNGSGSAPFGLSAVEGTIPRYGALSVSVPGTLETWHHMADRYGTRPLSDLLATAIHLAEDGFLVDKRLAVAIERVRPELADYPGLARLIEGNGARAGETFHQPELAATLRRVARGGVEVVYEGEVGEALVRDLAARGGVLTIGDLSAHHTTWLDPISVEYRGRLIHEHPPVSLGIVLLEELKILEGFDPGNMAYDGPELVDLMTFCKQAAFRDAFDHIGDPTHEPVPVEWMISEDRAASWRAKLSLAAPSAVAGPEGADTTSLAVADGSGNTVNLIHSLFNEFGSREVPEGTGIVLNDRLGNLVLEGGRPGGIRPGHRPVHTLNTFMMSENGSVRLAGSTPGGRGQVQTLFQVLVHYIDHGLDLGEALTAPRWIHGSPRSRTPDDVLILEHTFPLETVTALAGRHEVRAGGEVEEELFGSCTVVGRRPEDGVLVAAADHRRRAVALAY